MRKRNLILIIVSLIIIIAFVFVILLSNKNKKLGFISDEYRQITLVTNIYKEILDERLNEKILLNKD